MPIRKVLSIWACLIYSSGSTGQTMTESAEWIELFNGENLEGWRTYGEAEARPAWIVEDGAIKLDADESTTEMTGGDLITEEQFDNFELELEWRVTAGGNSRTTGLTGRDDHRPRW